MKAATHREIASGKYSVKMIMRNAKERHPGALGVAEAMLIAYNNKNKYRLPMRKLYGKTMTDYLEEEEDDDDYEETI